MISKADKKSYFSDYIQLEYKPNGVHSSIHTVAFNKWTEGCGLPQVGILKCFASKREDYKEEAKKLENLSSLYPNCIVKYYHRQTIERKYCIFMELCEHGSVAAQMRVEYWNIPKKLIISIEILSALSALHAGKSAHRDIKPDNIFLTVNDEVRIGDFDFQKEIRLCVAVHTVGGTPAYMSPFLKRLYDDSNKNIKTLGFIDPLKEDVWSTGITLYEIFTKERRDTILGDYKYDPKDPKKVLQAENKANEIVRTKLRSQLLQDEAIEIIIDMLKFDSSSRITMAEARDRFINLPPINRELISDGSGKVIYETNQKRGEAENIPTISSDNSNTQQRESSGNFGSANINSFLTSSSNSQSHAAEEHKTIEIYDGGNGEIEDNHESSTIEAEENKFSSLESTNQNSAENEIRQENAVSDRNDRFCEKCENLDWLNSFINEQNMIGNWEPTCAWCGRILS